MIRIIDAPNVLCMYSPLERHNFYSFLRTIDLASSECLHDGRYTTLKIDFSDCTYMSASGALALFSTISENQLNPKLTHLIAFELPKDDKLRNLFQKSGFWTAIKPGGNRKLNKLWNTDCPFQCGINADDHLEPALEKLEKFNLPLHLKEAIQEAVLNIMQHAYLPNKKQKRWWQYATYNRSKSKFVFVICDRGVTIPYHFPNQLGGDSSALAHAMTKGVSSTKLGWRGKGSGNLKKPVENDDKDELIIVSRQALYKYTSNETIHELSELTLPYNGTLIAWSFDLGEEN